MSNKKKVQVGGGYDEPTARVLFDGEGFENSGVGGLLFENGGSATGGFFIWQAERGPSASNDSIARSIPSVSVFHEKVHRIIFEKK